MQRGCVTSANTAPALTCIIAGVYRTAAAVRGLAVRADRFTRSLHTKTKGTSSNANQRRDSLSVLYHLPRRAGDVVCGPKFCKSHNKMGAPLLKAITQSILGF